jgi:uncharacterized protein YuzE
MMLGKRKMRIVVARHRTPALVITVYWISGVRRPGMQLRYDSEADVILVALRAAEGGEAGGKRLDEGRIAHLDQAGHIIAYEFIGASRGVSLTGIDMDDAGQIREAIRPLIQLAVA